MNHDDIIRMAKEAHKDLVTVDYPGHAGQLDPWTLRLLERFAALVAAAEREACLDLVNRGTGEATSADALKILRMERDRISAAIRARGGQI